MKRTETSLYEEIRVFVKKKVWYSGNRVFLVNERMRENFTVSQLPETRKKERNENPLHHLIAQKMQRALELVREKNEFYTGEEIETLFFGNRSDGNYTKETQETLRNQKESGVGFRGIEEYHNGKVRLDMKTALAFSLGTERLSKNSDPIPPERKVLLDQGVLLDILNMIFRTLPETEPKLSALTMIHTPMDIERGADALVYSAANDKERQETILEKRPFVSLGITTYPKKIQDISSDIEIYMPGDIDFVRNFLQNPDELFYIAKSVFVTSKKIFQEKMEKKLNTQSAWRKTHQPVLIHCPALLERKRNPGALH